ncbi:MAG: cupredoxin domain-containing protein [Methanosarcinales archaeon]|nr:cupredoxin domain-containing protein [ANME-2 cluster archaeon]MDW7777156.1 cupredoxin domain-containing protein [Methanosarcinales archaeon]
MLLILILVSIFTTIGCTYTNIPEPTETATETPTATPTTSPTATPVSTPRNGLTEVTMEGNAFVPETITIPMKGVVKWTNMDSTPHKIKIIGMVTEDLGEGDSFIWTFNQIGTYEYSCKYHPNMKGTVIVQ